MSKLKLPELPPWAARVAKWVGYPVFALAVAFSTLYLTLPRERIKEQVETLAQNTLGAEVTIDDLSLTFFSGPGVDLTAIKVNTLPRTPGDKPQRYVIDEVVAHPGIFDLLRQRQSASFAVYVGSGSAKGRVSVGLTPASDASFTLKAKELPLGELPVISRPGGLPLEGTLALAGELELPMGKLAQSGGDFELGCEDCVIGDGKAKLTVPGNPMLAQGLTFPRLKLGKLAGKIAIEKGRATFKGFHSKSVDAEIFVEGYVDLRDPAPLSQLHLYLRLKLSDALVKREPTLELINNVIGAQARRSDGFLGFAISGTFGSPLALPSRQGPAGTTAAPGAPPPPAAAAFPGAGPRPGGFVPPPPGNSFVPPSPPPEPPPQQPIEEPARPPDPLPPRYGQPFNPSAAPPPSEQVPVQTEPANAVPPPANIPTDEPLRPPPAPPPEGETPPTVNPDNE